MTDEELIAEWDTLTLEQQKFISLTRDLDGRSTIRIMREDGIPPHGCLEMGAPGLTYKQRRRRRG